MGTHSEKATRRMMRGQDEILRLAREVSAVAGQRAQSILENDPE
jgi:hypothetical protein